MPASTRFRSKALVTIAILTGSLFVIGAAASGDPERSPNEDVVVTGAVTSADHEPLPRTVTVFAWPANEAIADLEVGDKFALDPLGSSRIAPDGSFEVSLGQSDELQPYASEEGEVNLYVSSDNGEQEFGSSAPVDLDEVSNVDSGELDVGVLSPIGETGDVTKGSALFETTARVDAYTQKACYTKKLQNLGNKWIPVGGLFSTNSGATVDFQYGSGTSSTLSAMESKSSATSGFSVSGSTSISSSASVDFPTTSTVSSRLARTQFRFGKYEITCVYSAGLGSVTTTSYVVRADLWVGGVNTVAVSPPSATYCASYAKGSGFTKDQHKQVTWTGSATFYGVGLSAQTGWTTTGRLAIKFPKAAGRICGNGNYATQSNAYQIVVK